MRMPSLRSGVRLTLGFIHQVCGPRGELFALLSVVADRANADIANSCRFWHPRESSELFAITLKRLSSWRTIRKVVASQGFRISPLFVFGCSARKIAAGQRPLASWRPPHLRLATDRNQPSCQRAATRGPLPGASRNTELYVLTCDVSICSLNKLCTFFEASLRAAKAAG